MAFTTGQTDKKLNALADSDKKKGKLLQLLSNLFGKNNPSLKEK